MQPTGYLHPAYVDSLSEFGTPRALPSSGAWILTRAIPGASANDAMGCYPIFGCPNWSGLPSDLMDLKDLVCLSLVTDPFGDYDSALLQKCFPDLMLPFKQHFVVDLAANPNEFLSAHHRRNVRKALCSVTVTHCEDPVRYNREWINLYSHLVRRHAIRGIPAFSELALRRQLEVPGLQMFRADLNGNTVGMILWMVQNGIAYYHLGAYNEVGYRERASFALFWVALEFFCARHIRWLSLGAGAGVRDEVDDGLTRFKRGWSTGTRLAYLCGRILDHDAYARLLREKAVTPHDYFPAYRKGEFG
jgi:Acetyltransferase (GNAT) domain